jgi:hypothetical protein
MSESARLPSPIVLLFAGVVLLCGCIVAADHLVLLQAYLFSVLFWIGISVGSLTLLMLQHLAGGRWGQVIQRPLESAAATLPLCTLLFVPVLIFIPELYLWASPEALDNPLIQHKAVYLNNSYFVMRSLVYFVIWSVLAWLLNRWSRLQDQSSDPQYLRRMNRTSAPGLIAIVATVTLASVDWMMSLEPEWYSMIYGVLVLTGFVLSALSFAIICIAILSTRPPLSDEITEPDFHDLGNLLLTFVMLWTYMMLSQYLVIWMGNLPEEVTWYTRRLRGGWEIFPPIIVGFQFVLPFFLLLFRRIKRQARYLGLVAALVLALRIVETYWLIMPAVRAKVSAAALIDTMCFIAVGALWAGGFLWFLRSRPLLTRYPPMQFEEDDLPGPARAAR